MNTKRGLIVVGLQLEGDIADALDNICGVTLDSRASFVRRALVHALREEGYLPAPPAPRRVTRRELEDA